MEQHFDIARIIGAKIVDARQTSHRWLPAKQKTWFFGLFKRSSWHSEGFYSNGCYQECYESGCWDATPSTKQQLEEQGYQVDGWNNVYNKPHVTIYLEHECQVTKSFDSYTEAQDWVEELKAISGKVFEIVKYPK